jgi:hypothetical protein
MTQQLQTAEGVEEMGVASYTNAELEYIFEEMIRRKMVDALPGLIEQVRVSEEMYLTGQDQPHAHAFTAGLCAKAARALLDIKYGPIRGLESTPPVVNGRWSWR